MKKNILTLALFATVSTAFASHQDNVPSIFTAGISESAHATQSRWVKELSGDKEATFIAKKLFVEKFVSKYQALFQQYKKVNQAQFIYFEEQQLNDTIQAHREASIKQAHVRFGVLNKNKDDRISLKEFQDIGEKSFNSFDKNQDGIVNEEDAKLETKKSSMHGGAMFEIVVSIPVATDVNSFIEQHGQGKDDVTLARFLTEREKQFIDTDTNHDWGVSEDEYVTEFTHRYDQNASEAKARLNVFYNERFVAIAQGKPQISQKDVKHFAESVFKYWDKNSNGQIEIGE